MRGLLYELHRLPDLGILAVIVIVVTGLTMLSPHIGRHILRFPRNSERDAAVFDAFKAIMAMAGVVLAFSLVQANANLHSAQALADKEGSVLSDLDRTLLRSGIPALIELRPALASYAHSLVADEWPALQHGESSAKPDPFYTVVSKGARTFAPVDNRQTTMYAELLRQLDTLSDLRTEIANAADAELPSFFWIATGGLLGIGVILGALADASLARTVGMGATSAAVALLLAFVVIIDRPFEGETAVGPDAIQKAIAVSARRQP